MKTPDLPESLTSPRRLILACGALVAMLVLAFVVVGVVVEAREVLREGASTFFSDAALRIAFGACIAVLSALPYVLLARAARQPGPPRFFAVASVLTLVVQLYLTAGALFFGQSSTSAIAVLFIPIYLIVAVLVVWGGVMLFRRFQLTRAP